MDFHIVQPGDTIDSIASKYNVSATKMVRDNELKNPNQLLIGQTIVVASPNLSYIVKEGDNLEQIAANFNITMNELLRNNSFLTDRDYIYPGEELAISYIRKASIRTHGFANVLINDKTLRKTLPYLTYLTVFNYRTSQNGEVIATSDDTELLYLTKAYGVVPLMLMTTISARGDVDMELTYEVLINKETQNRLFDNVINILREKGYYGVNISAQFITSENQELFYNYTKNLSKRLSQEGYITVITFNPSVVMLDNEIFFEKIDYSNIGKLVDSALFLQYKWGTNLDPPAPVISVYNTSVFLDYVIPQLEREKIFISLPILGYDWELPYVPGFSSASALTLESIKDLAQDTGSVIKLDELSQSPYFQYKSSLNEKMHEVWYINAITTNSMLIMLSERGISGIGIWNIMIYFNQIWLTINGQYKIVKLLPEF